MKKYLILSFACLCAGNAIGQTRLIGVSNGSITHDGSYVFGDTLAVLYRAGNTHAGTAAGFDANIIACDTVQRWDTRLGRLNHASRDIYHYDAMGRRDTIRKQIYDHTAADFKTNRTLSVTYNANGDTAVFYDHYGVVAARDTYEYNGTVPVQVLHQQYDDTGWVVTGKEIFTHGANGLERKETYRPDINGVVNLKWIHEYHYNAAGLPDTVIHRVVDAPVAGDTGINRYIYTYDAAGRVIKAETDALILGIYTSAGYIVYTYDASGRVKTDTVHQRTSTQVKVYSYHTSGEVDTFKVINDGKVQARIFSYDADGNRIQSGWYKQNGLIWEPIYGSAVTKYYYNTTTSVPSVQKQALFSLYPNPASDMLTIKLANDDSKPYGMAIYDAAGRCISKWQPQLASSTHVIPVHHLPAGTYILTISNGAEKQSQQFVVAR
ncbi:MAG TPA: T9SS type A sorting domain-containing protein [Flavipsychrobacter sp.]